MGVVLAGISSVTLSAQGSSADEYARYSVPGQCIKAIQRLDDQYWRDKRPDTVTYGPEKDSIPAMALQGGKACASRFTIDNVPEKELLNLAKLYWMLGEDQKASAVATKLLAAPSYSNQDAKTYLLYNLVSSLANMKPSRFDLANGYLTQIDNFGKSAAWHRSLGNFSYSVAMLKAGNVDSSHTLAGKAVTAMREMEISDKIDLASVKLNLYSILSEVVSLQKSAGAAMNFIDSVELEILKLRPQGTRDYESLESRVNYSRSPYKLLGTSAMPVAADKWFGIQVGDTILPRSDVPTFIFLFSHACGGRCYPSFATLNRVYNDYSSKGLKYVVLSSTGGYYRNKLVVPSAEVDSAGKYFTEFLKLPSVVAMSESEFVKIHDGRRRNSPSINSRNYSRGRNGILVGKDGVVKLVVDVSPDRERVIRQALDRLY